MDDTVRLLVHAGASSTRQDDDERVMQVAAYLDLDSTFEIRRHVIWPPEGVGNQASQERITSTSHAREDEEPDSTTFIDDTQLAYTFLESQLFTSPARTTRLTPAKRPDQDHRVTSTAPAPSKAIRLTDSPVLHPQSSERAGRIEHDQIEVDHTLISTEPAVTTEIESSEPKHKERTQTIEGTITSNDTTSELPHSYSLEDVSDGLHSRPHLSERSLSDPGPSPVKQSGIAAVAPQVPSQAVPSTRGQEQPLAAPSGLPVDHQAVLHTTEPVKGAVEAVVTTGLPLKADILRQELSTSIEPGGPVTSIESFSTHVTPTLQKLAMNSELSATFVPTVVERDLSVHERGYWEVQCPNWNSELQTSFWKTLETVVGTGKAGWGVWCTRGPEAPLYSQSSQQRSEPAEQAIGSSFGPIRVYCWGEIAKHIYLLLFIASNSKVRKLGLRWIDAQGLVVLQMRAG